MTYIDSEREQKLIRILLDLSDTSLNLEDEDIMESFFCELEDVYWVKEEKRTCRHQYSVFFDVLTTIDDSEKKDIETLVQNLEAICKQYLPLEEEGGYIDITEPLNKLYDHISLDVKRLQYTKKLNYQHKKDVIDVVNTVKNIEKNITNKIKDTVEKVEADYKQNIEDTKESIIEKNKEETTKMRAEYISILGIFSSIVLAFVGGLTFSTSVLENINKASVYRIFLMAFVIGLVFFNIIWILLDFIKRVHGETVKRTYIWWGFNGIMLAGMLLSSLAYKYDWFEKEEQYTAQKNQQLEQRYEESDNDTE